MTGQIKSLDDVKPELRSWPWFQPGNFEVNLQLASQVEELAKKKGVTPAS